jgi:hypothetical protein
MSMIVNGKLSRPEQIEIKRREQEILASNNTDNWKAVEIDMLYRQRGLEPGSFDYPSGSSAHSSSSDDSDSGGSIKTYLLIFAGAYLLLKVCEVFQKHFPAQGDAFKSGLISFLDGLCSLIAMLWKAL